MENRACSGRASLSKAAFLSMTGGGPFKPTPLAETPIAEDRKQKILEVIQENGGNLNRASVVLGISASSLRRRLAQWSSPPAIDNARPRTTRAFYEGIQSPWSVQSFDSEKREVCIEIRTPSSTNILSFGVPSWRFPD